MSDIEVLPELKEIIGALLFAAKKPVAAICIAPAILSKVLGADKVPHELTIGTDEGMAEALGKMGSSHIKCPAREFVVDESIKLVSTPAYLLAGSISEAAEGIEKTISALMKMID